MPVDLSVIVPTAGRPDSLVRLLEGLARQSLPSDRFEVVVTDDGTEPPIAPVLARLRLPFALECRQQPRCGPAAARNRAIAAARGRVLVILNDDAGPPRDLLERHWNAQNSSPEPRAYLGRFEFAPECDTAFARAAVELGLVFPYRDLKRDGPNPGRFFWTCNLSVPRAEVLAAGAFDERFTRPVCEDVELGYRLEKRGVAVWFLDGAPCLHHHRVDAAWLMRRQVELGRWAVELWRKHRDADLFPWIRAASDETTLATALEREAVARGRQFEEIAQDIDAIDAIDGVAGDPAIGAAVAARVVAIAPRLKQLNDDALRLGLLAGLAGWDAAEAWDWLASLPPLTTLVVARCGDPVAQRARVTRLRALAAAPVEVMELPSERSLTDGPLRDQLLARSRGERICFVDDGFQGEPSWLREALRSPAPAVSIPGRFRLVRRDVLAHGPISSQARPTR